MRVHLMGAGGAGVSALARVFLARGDEVTGVLQAGGERGRGLLEKRGCAGGPQSSGKHGRDEGGRVPRGSQCARLRSVRDTSSG